MEVSREKLKQIRKSKKLTQQQFGDMLEISREMVNKMEKGHVAISPKTVFRLIDEYGYKLEDMLPDTGAISEPDHPYYKGIPVFSIPLTASFLLALNGEPPLVPAFYLDKRLFSGCAFIAPANADNTMQEIRKGDYLVCEPVTDFTFLDYSCLYFIAGSNGIELCRYIQPHPGDETRWLLKSDQENIPAFPIYKNDITHLYRVRGIIRRL
jgi:transcriptional regulator with XRE-family HTH domain